MPALARIDMPEQDFGARPDATLRPEALDGRIGRRRLFLIIGSFLIGLFCTSEIAKPLAFDGIDAVDITLMLLFFGLYAWIAFGFLCAFAGFFSLIRSDRSANDMAHGSPLPERSTAVLIPIYNEDVAPLTERIRAMLRSVEKTGVGRLFDFFILSDSAASAEAIEMATVKALRSETNVRLHYRRRTNNVARKPGNIHDWVTRFGGAYEKMLVLDADSLMTGEAMTRLARTMEDNPRVGLLQTVPALVGSKTLFARWQQFAATLYGPVASAGLQWWSGSEATFWGHNAIIRVQAFAESCGLPKLSGPEPFGGYIMSHDMVEAALLRRRGWAVQIMPLPEGSYEEFPPTLIDHAVRDRRWCQGNIQHLRLLHSAGFHWVNRLQLLMGASAYLTSPLWLMLLLAGVTQAVRAELPAFLFQPSHWLIMMTVTLLMAPKLIALAWALGIDHDLRDRLGGTRKILLSVIAEIPLSVAMAPVMMFSQCIAITQIMRGRPSGWSPQRRDVDGLDPRAATKHYRYHMMLGLFFAATSMTGLDGAIWTMPVAVSLVCAPWLAILSSRISLGSKAAAYGVFPSVTEEPITLLAPATVVKHLGPTPRSWRETLFGGSGNVGLAQP